MDWLCYFMVGTSADNAPISRFIDNKIHNTHSVPYVGKLYDLFITDGAKDQGYPKGGLQSIINSVTSSFPEGRVKIITNERVVKIEGIRREDQVFRADQVITNRDSYECDTVVYSGFSSRLPDLVDDLPSEYTENLSSIKKVKSLTIWLGLTKRLFLNYGSEMWVDSDPYAWVVPTTNYDPTLAPRGNHLVGFAFTLDGKYDMAKIKKKAFQSIVGKVPDIEDHIDMIHYQELVPEKASWGLNLGFGDVRTPVKNLYCVGTDTAKRSAGVNRSAYSVLKCLDLMRSDGVLR